MGTAQTADEQSKKSQGLGTARTMAASGILHADHRIQHGFAIGAVLAEFRALRATVLRLYEESGGTDLTEVRRFNESIDEALTASMTRFAAQTDVYRDQFVGILSHDLRTPLGAITTGAALLRLTEENPERRARVAATILNSAQRMERMISDLLDLTQARRQGRSRSHVTGPTFGRSVKMSCGKFERLIETPTCGWRRAEIWSAIGMLIAWRRWFRISWGTPSITGRNAGQHHGTGGRGCRNARGPQRRGADSARSIAADLRATRPRSRRERHRGHRLGPVYRPCDRLGARWRNRRDLLERGWDDVHREFAESAQLLVEAEQAVSCLGDLLTDEPTSGPRRVRVDFDERESSAPGFAPERLRSASIAAETSRCDAVPVSGPRVGLRRVSRGGPVNRVQRSGPVGNATPAAWTSSLPVARAVRTRIPTCWYGCSPVRLFRSRPGLANVVVWIGWSAQSLR